jgi:hypothetical protein
MSKAEMIAEAFDLQRRSKLCNIRECGKLPTKRVTLFEENRITGDKKTLATICLCNEYYQTRIPLFLTEINKPIERGKVIEKKVQDMGFITH